MKIALFAAVSLSLLAASASQAQSTATSASTRRARTAASAREGSFVAPRTSRATTNFTLEAPRVGGVIPRAARVGNPLQLINPFAPAEYGSANEVTRHEDSDPYQRPAGINLVTFEF